MNIKEIWFDAEHIFGRDEEGHEYKTYLTKKFLERKMWKAPDPLQVLSHIPGSVIEIFVKPGQKVKKGDKLMIYEAMKMMN